MRLENNKWKMLKLGDCCQFFNGKAHEKQIDNNGNYIVVNSKFISSSGAIYKKTKEALFPLFKNDIVMVMSDVPKGKALAKCYLIEEDNKYSLNQRICAIRSDKIEAKFLYYHLNRHPYLLNFDNGENQTNLRKEDILKCPLYIPPIEEQKRIVEILDKAFEGIAQAEANTRRNLINARELFDSYLNSALIGFVLQETPQILADITELIIDCEHKTAPTQEMGYPSIRTPNIGKGYLTLDNVYRVSEETYQEWTRRAKPQANDLILAREAPAGNVGIVPEGEKVCLGQRTVLIRPKKTINSQYLAFYLLHPEMQKQLLYKSSGATVQHVNMKDIRSLKISYFPSMEVQQKLAEALQSIQSRSKQLETIYQRKLEAIAELKQSILEKAFTGQLSQ